ncbi:MAG: hypothetical protein JOZ78_13710 [Chroococcidiopsidaceae cyanobacterium CP_BM_ER_R8_30]|nr:hypothetical protein [Chroococcidiopsidaceae cyanobacterium CP_BM_ER_R8_30]
MVKRPLSAGHGVWEMRAYAPRTLHPTLRSRSSLGSSLETSGWETGKTLGSSLDHFIIPSKPSQVDVNGGFAKAQAFQLP